MIRRGLINKTIRQNSNESLIYLQANTPSEGELNSIPNITYNPIPVLKCIIAEIPTSKEEKERGVVSTNRFRVSFQYQFDVKESDRVRIQNVDYKIKTHRVSERIKGIKRQFLEVENIQ